MYQIQRLSRDGRWITIYLCGEQSKAVEMFALSIAANLDATMRLIRQTDQETTEIGFSSPIGNIHRPKAEA